MIICLGTTPTLQRTMTFARLQIDSVNRAIVVHEFASGKSINAARVVHALGEPVLATGFLGGDSGRLVRADLNRAGIAHDFIEVQPATRLCLTLLDESQRTATELIEESKPLPRDLYDRLLSGLASLLPRAGVLILSGTLPPEAPQHFYADCVALAASHLPVILDAKGPPLECALSAHPMVVKVNRSELAVTLNAQVSNDDTTRRAMSTMIDCGARWVVVTAGKLPTFITDGKEFWKVQTPHVAAINPIGSGDALAAGLAVGMVRSQDVPQACVLGVACAVANAMTPHAGHVIHTNVERLLNDVRLEHA